MNDRSLWGDKLTQRLALLDAVALENPDFAGLLLASTEAVIGLDKSGRVVLFNPSAQELTGWTAEDVLGNHWEKLLAPTEDGEPGPEDATWDQTKGDESSHLKLSVRTKDGGILKTSVSYLLLHDRAGDTVNRVLILRDITRDTEIERFRKDFLSGVSHELLTPLSALGGCAELLMDNHDAMSRQDLIELLQIMRDGTARLEHLVQNLLDAGRIQSGHFRVYLQKMDASALASDAVALVESMLWRRRQSLKVTIPDGLGEVLADRDRITQVLVNLLSNASKYSPEGTPVTLEISRDGEAVRVEVQDRGAGIPAEDRPYVFRRFYRAAVSAGGEASGVGLGLAICKSIVEMHGGEIGLDSRSGQGTTVWFTVPRLSEARGDGREDINS